MSRHFVSSMFIYHTTFYFIALATQTYELLSGNGRFHSHTKYSHLFSVSQKKKLWQGDRKKSDNKAGWVLACMFLIVDALLSSQRDWAQRSITYMICFSFDYHIEQFFLRCLINETEFQCYISKEWATATLPESLASHLQMSGGPSNDSRSSATPVTDRKAAENTTRKCQVIKKRVQRNYSVYAKNCPWNLYLIRIAPPNSQTMLQLKHYKLKRVQLLTADNKLVRLAKCLSTTPSSRRTSEQEANSVRGWKAIHHRTSPQTSER